MLRWGAIVHTSLRHVTPPWSDHTVSWGQVHWYTPHLDTLHLKEVTTQHIHTVHWDGVQCYTPPSDTLHLQEVTTHWPLRWNDHPSDVTTKVNIGRLPRRLRRINLSPDWINNLPPPPHPTVPPLNPIPGTYKHSLSRPVLNPQTFMYHSSVTESGWTTCIG